MDPDDLADLEPILKALAHPSRLRLLVALQKPRRAVELDLAPSKRSAWGSEERSISRQATGRHLRALEEIGVVHRLKGKGQEVQFVVHHARLFELTERLRKIATVRPVLDVQEETMEMDATGGVKRHQGPHLVLVRGVREGALYPLVVSPGEAGWVLGRDKGADVPLDYDPFVSGEHARIIERDGKHFLVDVGSNRNGTFLNWQRMTKGGVAPLEPGDVIMVGMSMLLYRG